MSSELELRKRRQDVVILLVALNQSIGEKPDPELVRYIASLRSYLFTTLCDVDRAN
jgi:hypothetical protein